MQIFYFTGTGNSYRVSRWLAEESQKKGTPAAVTAIEQADPRNYRPREESLTGIVMPTHGFTIPWLMLKFVLRLPRSKSGAFVVSTRAGAKYGPIPGYPPGIAGSSFFIAALVLKLKGYKIRGMMSVNMASNWMSLHSSISKKNVEEINRRAEIRTEEFTDKLLNGARAMFPGNIAYELFWAVALAYVSAGYFFLGRFFLARLFFANNTCTGCGICADNCPTGAIAMLGKKKPRPYWSYNCESCMRCMGFCPHNSIEAGHSWGVLLYFAVMVPVSFYIINWSAQFIPPLSSTGTHYMGRAIQLAYYFPALFISYHIFNLLIRIKPLNALFTYTTLTHYYRRYHEPETRLKDFK